MVYVHNCDWCSRPWNFHDEQVGYPRLCDECQGKYNDLRLFQDIMAGKFKTKERESDA